MRCFAVVLWQVQRLGISAHVVERVPQRTQESPARQEQAETEYAIVRIARLHELFFSLKAYISNNCSCIVRLILLTPLVFSSSSSIFSFFEAFLTYPSPIIYLVQKTLTFHPITFNISCQPLTAAIRQPNLTFLVSMSVAY